ncbi:hypothetical protein SAMD00019534_036860 [Acytostelium subglobosum LB1]|uniref:hypothetical protein n=1 Tax=Acytostelium subglobosum LB1 TaxID=1410327 RepID=UPI000644A482|nr:hypothetical protein SAMD00019534_036860 [Acytostelium subglobosum LB1]GAM20511.1 hypothetical protein SAMD00019534_036860 [Acytostelium subglobosum LB1]|eukprot:XP_012760032.1 hypothetical protein SAMD00019534_036860 [Acytostelium subglobosum LB1]
MLSKLQIVLVALMAFIAIAHSTTLTASPSVLKTSGDDVTITWKDVTTPSEDDVIAIYYPVDSDITSPIGYVKMTTSSTWAKGFGSVTVPLVNTRAEYNFRVWVPGTKAPTMKVAGKTLELAATSNGVNFENPNAPGKVYLAHCNYTSEMRVVWISGSDDTPYVYVGNSPSNITTKFTGDSFTYSIGDMCDAPANDPKYFKDPGYFHDVKLEHLEENTEYFYYVGSEKDGNSQVYSFISSPYVGSEAYFIAFGDLGVNTPFIAATSDMQTPAPKTVANIYQTITAPFSNSPLAQKLGKKPTNGLNTPPSWSILHIGDISYARGYAFIWDYFQEYMTEIASRAPYMVTIGNHEYDFPKQPFKPSWSDFNTDSGGECGVPFSKRYHMTGAEGTPQRNVYYSYNNGPVHVTVMSMEHDFLVGSLQYQWLEEDLKNVDRSATPWVVFTGHRPMYDSARPGGAIGMMEHLQSDIEPLLVKYDVNMCLWGHVHVYERMCGMVKGECAKSDNDAPVHVLIGMAGNTYQTVWNGDDINSQGEGHEDQPSYSVFRAINYGYTRFYANTTDLYFEFVGNNRNIVHDNFWLKSKYSINQ